MDSGKLTFCPGRSSRRILVMALVLSLALPLTFMASSIPAAYATTSRTISGTGTFADIYVKILSIQMVGSNTVIEDEGLGKVTGMLTGTYAFTATITVQPNGIATYSATDGCQCTIGGKTGGLLFSEQGSGNEITGAFQSQAVITQSSNDLTGVTGTAILTGVQNPVTNLTTGTYTITLSMPSSRQSSGASYTTEGATYGTTLPYDDAQRAPAPSPTHPDASPANSVGAGTSHPVADHAAPLPGHSDSRHTTAAQSPSKPAAPAPNTHVHHSHPHR